MIIACLRLRGRDETSDTFRAPTPLLFIGLAGNVVLLYYVISTDPGSLVWCAGRVAVGLVLFAVEAVFGRRDRPAGTDRGVSTLGEGRS